MAIKIYGYQGSILRIDGSTSTLSVGTSAIVLITITVLRRETRETSDDQTRV